MTKHNSQAKIGDKEIITSWHTGQSSLTMVIPKNMALLYDIYEPGHIVVECTDKGILIRKLIL